MLTTPHLLFALLLVALALIALLWYGLRTRKTPAELENKINTSVDTKLAAMKAETAAAIEAAKTKL